MRFAIADPPYLGRGARWYGDGRGTARGKHQADHHPQAGEWDDPARHVALVEELTDTYDGWAIAAAADSLRVYLPAVPLEARVMVWHRRNAPPSGSRIRNVWEPVIIHTPRRGRAEELLALDDVLTAPGDRIGFLGAKPDLWTRWVLYALGVTEADEVVDLFPGSGSIGRALTQGALL